VALLLLLTVVATTAVLIANSTRSSAAGPAVATTRVPLGPGATEPTVTGTTPTSTLPAAPGPTTTSGPLPHAPGSPSTSTPTTPGKPPANPNALTAWPGGQSGYTVVLESLPVANGRSQALARARKAKGAGLPQVGILVSSQYSSLHAGYYAIFSGIYRTQDAAAAAISRAHASGFPDAYQTRVTR
jgi:hypothetical protein